MTRRASILVLPLLLLVLLPALISAAGTHGAAPSAQAAGVTPAASASLEEARRAVGEASSQAGFLLDGTQQLVDGVGAGDGKDLLAGAKAAADGSAELSAGLVELQAATGQLGSGAAAVATGVEHASEPLIAIGVVVGQVRGSVDRAITNLEGNPNPEAARAREELIAVRKQLDNVPVDSGAVAELEKLRTGARDIANQLGTPGYAYHDGVYSATAGAQELASGLAKINGQLGGSEDGIGALSDGATRLHSLAQQTDSRIAAADEQLTALATGAGADAPASTGVAGLDTRIAILISALVMLGGFATALTLVFGTRLPRLLVAGGGILVSATAGEAALLTMATGIGGVAAVVAFALFVLTALAAVGLTGVFHKLFGALWGTAVTGAFGVVQLAVVGWGWATMSVGSGAAPTWVAGLLGALPLHWATSAQLLAGTMLGDGALVAALPAFGAASVQFAVAVGVLATLSIFGAILGWRRAGRAPRPAAV
ncbi:hypothetical protein [Corynebacterium uterequi]|uniref:X-X-X-Leu-X-X-Gly heptad repeat-containing protein n=1 Tax=Corynebacterium uterequi TaxID=1072256 RepID=A0A0G3HA04_9CORY|nr:hypothetical protein [Corynebacterium uterequi]AKK10181.1 hypothetical protein CUTER_00795 [Corynebacterium uterequi]